MKKIITICAFAACLTGCDDLFEPAIENNLGLEYMYENSQYAEGILANAYTRIPCAGYSFNAFMQSTNVLRGTLKLDPAASGSVRMGTPINTPSSV